MFAVFVTVAVKVFVPLVTTVAVVGATEIATGIAAAGHLPLFAFAGAVVVAAVELTTTLAVSVLPASSATVNCKVIEPVAGATTVAVAVFAP